LPNRVPPWPLLEVESSSNVAVEHEIPFETELIERIGWLIRLRWLAVLGTGVALLLAWFLYGNALYLPP
jgi:hypothetical protein